MTRRSKRPTLVFNMGLRYGLCLNMVSSSPTRIGEERIPVLSSAGYDYAELPLAETVQLTEDMRENIRKQLDAHDIGCEVMNNFFPRTIRLTGPDVDWDAVMAYADRALETAQDMGADIIVFGSGPAKHVPDGFPLEDGYDQIVSLLKELGPKAEEKGITIVIEPLRKAECNLINTFAEGVRLAEDVGHPAVKVLVDYYHLSVENEPLAHVEEHGRQFLRHVHYANPRGRVYPKPDETHDADRRFFETLKQAGYTGRISIEAYTEDFARAAALALQTVKSLEK